MNYTQKDWYNELYRVFSCAGALLTETQAIKVGDCMRSIMAGENITYKLEDLYQSLKSNKKIATALENYMHEYINHIKKDAIEQSPPKIEQEVQNYGTLQSDSQ